MFSFLKKKEEFSSIDVKNHEIVAPADGKLIDVTTVSDEIFAQKMLGESIAFRFEGNEVTVCSPANGTLAVLFPTGHAFGCVTSDGVELLVHIGINTVNSNGAGFTALKKQGETVKAGDPVVKVNLKELSKSYDMSTMLIVTNANKHTVEFAQPTNVTRGQVIGNIA